MNEIKVGDRVTVRLGWGSLKPGDVVEVANTNEYDDVMLVKNISDREQVNYGWTNNLNVVRVDQEGK